MEVFKKLYSHLKGEHHSELALGFYDFGVAAGVVSQDEDVENTAAGGLCAFLVLANPTSVTDHDVIFVRSSTPGFVDTSQPSREQLPICSCCRASDAKHCVGRLKQS